MPVMIKDGRAVLFIHIPKTGGSTIERLFTSSGWEMHLHATRRTAPDTFRLFRCSPQHLHAAVLSELVDLARFDLVMTMVREPVARFRSEFAHRHARAGIDEVDAATVSAWADDVLSRYADNPYLLDNHVRPQSEFLLPGTETYRLEDGMEAMVADLNERFDLGLPAEVPHRLHSGERGFSSSAVHVSPELDERLREFYAADLDALDLS